MSPRVSKDFCNKMKKVKAQALKMRAQGEKKEIDIQFTGGFPSPACKSISLSREEADFLSFTSHLQGTSDATNNHFNKDDDSRQWQAVEKGRSVGQWRRNLYHPRR